MRLVYDKERGFADEPEPRDPMDTHVGRRLQLARTAMGWSQAALADRLHVSSEKIGSYESGADQIGASRLYRLANLFEVSVQFFFDGAASETCEDPPSPPSWAPGGTPRRDDPHKQMLHLVTAFDEIRNAEVQQALDDLVSVMRRSLAMQRARSGWVKPD